MAVVRRADCRRSNCPAPDAASVRIEHIAVGTASWDALTPVEGGDCLSRLLT